MNAENLFNLGSEAYDKNEYSKSLSFFLESADLGNASAMNYVGYMYSEAKGTALNYDKAFEYYMMAINNGDDNSFANIGVNFRCLGNIVEAKKWFEKAICVGDFDAALQLAKLYLVSDKETENVKKYLNLVIKEDNVCTSSKEEAQRLLSNL